MKTDCMELTRYLIGQGRSGREIYFANNYVLLLNSMSDDYVLNLAVHIMAILVSPEVIYRLSHRAFGQASAEAALAKVSGRWAESWKVLSISTLPLPSQHCPCGLCRPSGRCSCVLPSTRSWCWLTRLCWLALTEPSTWALGSQCGIICA